MSDDRSAPNRADRVSPIASRVTERSSRVRLLAVVIVLTTLRSSIAFGQCDDPEFRRFDFWVGEWSVTSNGQPAGTNRIERISNGCALLESWQGGGGTPGHSINYYDPHAGRWKQTWVGGGGAIMEFVEVDDADHEGDMRFIATVQQTGGAVLRRMTFTESADGTVRQYIEDSTDGGVTWSVWFDGLYTRRENVEATPGS